MLIEKKLTKAELYGRCLRWELAKAVYFELHGDQLRARGCRNAAADYERKYQELPEVAHLYKPPQGAFR